MSWISDIFKSSLEEPPKKQRNSCTSSAHKESSPVQWTNFVAKLGKVKCTLLFALLLNDEDGNRQINQEWDPFCHVALVPLSHVNFYEILIISISI